MNGGQLVDLVVTLLAAALIGVIGYLLRGRFSEQQESLDRLTGKVDDLGRDVVRLTEAQKALVASQAAQNRVSERLIDDSDDLADKVDQLNSMTHRLYDRLRTHENYLRTLGVDSDDMD